MGPEVSVVIPTYNEARNVPVLLEQLQEALAGVTYEAIVVDDDSPDGTADAARAVRGTRVIVRKEERGLATAVIEGFRQARGRYVVVMDADLQHPPEVVRRMLDEAQDGADLVIGSRYVEGGSDAAFSPVRKLVSRGARLIGKMALPPLRRFQLTDPMSGLFMVRSDRVDPESLRPVGYKILLEVIGRGDFDDVREVGFRFGRRHAGDSKLGAAVMVQYLMHLASLAVVDRENRRMAKFAAVGASGVVVNLGILYALTEGAGLFYLASALIAIEASIVTNFLLNDAFTFHDRRDGHVLARMARFNAVSLGALLVNLTVLVALTELLHVHYLISEAIAIVAAFAANYSGNTQWTYGGVERFRLRDALRSVGSNVGVWLPTAVLTVLALGIYSYDLDHVDEIYFDEHYYLSVARQIDNGIWHDPCWDGTDVDPRPLNYEHPPLAKLILAWSVSTFDTDHAVFEGCREPGSEGYEAWVDGMQSDGSPWAWRMPGVVMGALTVGAVAVVGRRLLGSPGDWIAGGFALADVILLSSSRVAILDIYATGFAVLAVAAATFASKRGILLAALFLGLGFASKYSVLFVGLPTLAVALWCHWRAGRLTRRRFDGILAALLVVPFLVWLAAYTPWLRLWVPDMGFTGAMIHLKDTTLDALRWLGAGEQVHEYASSPASWLLLERPMLFYKFEDPSNGVTGAIYSFGNPLVWWSAIAVVLGVIVREIASIGRGSLIRSSQGQAVVLAALLPVAVYGGFFLLARTAFIFYMTLVAPFLAIAAAAGVTRLAQQGLPGRMAALVWGVAVVAAFAWFYPLATGAHLDNAVYQRIQESLPWARW